MDLSPRGLSSGDRPILGSFSPSQNRAILIAGLTCACVSLLATLITLRWFMLMKRLFRHHLVLCLILSDTFKALWYFVFPIVVFARGPVESSSNWCQASGFFLTFAIEASDFAILLIALHAVLYVFRPPIRPGDGGLFPYRRWIPLLWLGYPLLAASLAFVNPTNAFVTAGTYCNLPQRPFWYRLVLSWIPRYMILSTIILMYAAISIYVHIKFRGFKNLGATTEPSGDNFSEKITSVAGATSPDEEPSPSASAIIQVEPATPSELYVQRSYSYQSPMDAPEKVATQASEPWDAMNFLTTRSLQTVASQQAGIETTDFAQTASPTPRKALMRNTSFQQQISTQLNADERKRSDGSITDNTMLDGPTATGSNMHISGDRSVNAKVVDPLRSTRLAIRQQLRFLFIYPAVYVVMWAFPFASNCLLYNDATASRPIFWLQIVSTCSISLQAGANCFVFSWKEKPWRRVDEDSVFSVPFWRKRSVIFAKNVGLNGSVLGGSRHASNAYPEQDALGSEQTIAPTTQRARSANWWEEEGKKRKDSVWLGTDLMTQITSRQSNRSMRSLEDRSASV